MSYTMTFDASHKVGRGGHAQAFFRHIARDVDQAAGFHFTHANKNIVPDRTGFNLTRVNDGAGNFRAPVSVDGRAPSQEFGDYLDARLATVSRALRKDAVLMRGLILQLDPRWFEEHDPDWRERGPNRASMSYMGASLDWACEEFGQPNVVGWSVHLDEYNPQLQVMVTPVTDDGRLSQKDFFKGPADLRRQHTELRSVMEAAGYDVEHRVTERSREHLSSSEFQAKADRLRDAAQEVEDEKDDYEKLHKRLAKRAVDLDLREADVDHRNHEAAAALAEAKRAAQAASEAERRAQLEQITAAHTRAEAESARVRLSEAAERLEQTPRDVDRWLDKVKVNGRPLRERFEADMARARATRKGVQRLLDPGHMASRARGEEEPTL